MNAETVEKYVTDQYLEIDEQVGEVFGEILDAPPYRQGLETVDSVLRDSGYEMTAHIGGQGYQEVAFEDEDRIPHLHLLIDEEPEDIWEQVDNAFFQRLYPGQSFQPDEFPYMSFQIGSPFNLTSDIAVGLDNMTVEYPTREEFLEYQVPMAMHRIEEF